MRLLSPYIFSSWVQAELRLSTPYNFFLPSSGILFLIRFILYSAGGLWEVTWLDHFLLNSMKSIQSPKNLGGSCLFRKVLLEDLEAAFAATARLFFSSTSCFSIASSTDAIRVSIKALLVSCHSSCSAISALS